LNLPIVHSLLSDPTSAFSFSRFFDSPEEDAMARGAHHAFFEYILQENIGTHLQIYHLVSVPQKIATTFYRCLTCYYGL